MLEQIRDAGERIGVHLSYINPNHLFQIPTGPGGTRKRKTGGE